MTGTTCRKKIHKRAKTCLPQLSKFNQQLVFADAREFTQPAAARAHLDLPLGHGIRPPST